MGIEAPTQEQIDSPASKIEYTQGGFGSGQNEFTADGPGIEPALKAVVELEEESVDTDEFPEDDGEDKFDEGSVPETVEEENANPAAGLEAEVDLKVSDAGE